MSQSLTVVLVLTAVCLLQPVSLQNDQLVAEFDKLKEEVSHLSQSLQMLNTTMQKEKNDPVMFYAVIRGKTLSYNVDTILVFETVILNEGGFYNNYDGVFVAPRKGMYLFSWTVSGSGTNTYTVTELVIENQIISSAGEYHGGAAFSSGSMTALYEMRKGDHAWIRSTGVSAAHNLYSHDNYPQSSFLGLLLVTK